MSGNVRVLLMTSRDTGRWIIPKGNIGAGTAAGKMAEKEAYEEAGVKGTIDSSMPIGTYTYSKKLVSGEHRDAVVEVYLLRVKKCLKKWPEKRERKLRWVAIEDAIGLVEEPGIVPLLLRLKEFQDDLVNRRRSPLFEARGEAV